MADTYQAIYDAVRSKISNGDIGHAVECALRDANLSHYADVAARVAQEAAYEYMRPSVLFRPRIFQDGKSWCALYGDNLQEGVCAFGDSPFKAAEAFDKAWNSKLTESIRAALLASAPVAEGGERG